INIRFKPTGITTAKNEYFLGALLLLAVAGFVFLRSVKPRKDLTVNQPAGMFTLGSLSFDAETRKLMIHGKTTGLTRTETRVLRVFALSPNETIERNRLQKEIWEDEGVIVGRSLDMFISKLRKKLEIDPDIKIVVIRGKGYKLEINS
ncbi:MAG TPA: winged helix-turn-helix domain-containing protein, partial [Puia sp.]|nr:winged helix-turn-helix domain-containing protein [Puia sp.]